MKSDLKVDLSRLQSKVESYKVAKVAKKYFKSRLSRQSKNLKVGTTLVFLSIIWLNIYIFSITKDVEVS